ncbi:carbonic anhydrase [Trametes versicolor FP-101664 SS1]|uniref:carbonic anhydrase n=1 Tax=Trametes versicolor (strain FP-101664) TaxID=717944 RepID=UPI00046247B5|nr:carbonic anhydrase [Trametes versicolor FP-101664 SS1]EIW56300.1 carbonic anhydrase [Trametes versicolor FP-101664 SS1]
MTMPKNCSPACLLSNNAKWADDIKKEDPEFFRNRCTDSNEPVTAALKPPVLYIGCSDWRVPESAVSAMLPNGIFVHRNIANQFHPKDDSALSVLAYAVENLRVTQIIVAGHTDCGGAKASLNAAHASPPRPPSDPLARWLALLTEIAGAYRPEDLTELIEANVRQQVQNIAKTEVVQAAWAAANANVKEDVDLQVHGWVYELETGHIRDLGVSVGKKGDIVVRPFSAESSA